MYYERLIEEQIALKLKTSGAVVDDAMMPGDRSLTSA